MTKPFSERNSNTSPDINWTSVSEWIEDRQPNTEKKFWNSRITVQAGMSGQGQTKGKQEYSSTMKKKVLVARTWGFRSQSTEILSKAPKMGFKWDCGGVKDLGFNWSQMEYFEHRFFTSSTEYWKFFTLTKWLGRVTPGWHRLTWIFGVNLLG